jgi:hypothetical protein
MLKIRSIRSTTNKKKSIYKQTNTHKKINHLLL